MLSLLNVDPMNPAGRPSPSQVKSAGFAGMRFVYRNHPDCYNYWRGCEEVGLKTLLVVARESLGPHTWQEFTPQEITNQYRPWAYQLGNEPDAHYNPGNASNSVETRQAGAPSSWVMSPGDYRNFHAKFAEHIRLADPDAMIVTAGLCSGIPSWFFTLAHGNEFDCNRIGVHPYGKDAREAEALLLEYAAGGGYPLVSEWNRPPEQISSYIQMLERHDAWDAAWFCGSSQMVEGYGLVDGDSLTAAGTAMLTALGTLPTPPPVDPTPPIGSADFVRGFKKFVEAGYADYVGHAVFPEFSPGPGLVVQQSSNGTLIWRQNYHPAITFIHHNNMFINWDEE